MHYLNLSNNHPVLGLRCRCNCLFFFYYFQALVINSLPLCLIFSFMSVVGEVSFIRLWIYEYIQQVENEAWMKFSFACVECIAAMN